MKKACSTCKKLRDLRQYTKNSTKSDGLNHVCKICQRAYGRAHYAANKTYYIRKARKLNAERAGVISNFLDWLKGVPCADCGVKFPPVCMDFDHVRGKKLFNLSDAKAVAWDIERIQAEVMKCEVVCSNCHRLRTQKRQAA
jgi:hypothetical protein